MLHELWNEGEGVATFCLAGLRGADARALLGPDAQLVWTIEAASHFEAMTLYHEHMGWAPYRSDFEGIDRQSYTSRGWE